MYIAKGVDACLELGKLSVIIKRDVDETDEVESMPITVDRIRFVELTWAGMHGYGEIHFILDDSHGAVPGLCNMNFGINEQPYFIEVKRYIDSHINNSPLSYDDLDLPMASKRPRSISSEEMPKVSSRVVQSNREQKENASILTTRSRGIRRVLESFWS